MERTIHIIMLFDQEINFPENYLYRRSAGARYGVLQEFTCSGRFQREFYGEKIFFSSRKSILYLSVTYMAAGHFRIAAGRFRMALGLSRMPLGHFRMALGHFEMPAGHPSIHHWTAHFHTASRKPNFRVYLTLSFSFPLLPTATIHVRQQRRVLRTFNKQ